MQELSDSSRAVDKIMMGIGNSFIYIERESVRACVRACVRVCVCVCVRARFVVVVVTVVSISVCDFHCRVNLKGQKSIESYVLVKINMKKMCILPLFFRAFYFLFFYFFYLRMYAKMISACYNNASSVKKR